MANLLVKYGFLAGILCGLILKRFIRFESLARRVFSVVCGRVFNLALLSQKKCHCAVLSITYIGTLHCVLSGLLEENMASGRANPTRVNRS